VQYRKTKAIYAMKEMSKTVYSKSNSVS